MSDEAIPDDIMEDARKLVSDLEAMPSRGNVYIAARAILAERNRVHRQLKGEGE